MKRNTRGGFTMLACALLAFVAIGCGSEPEEATETESLSITVPEASPDGPAAEATPAGEPAADAQAALPPAEPADAIVGYWLTDTKDARIEIYEEDGVYNGKIVWIEEPLYPADDDEAGQPKHDRNNPDEALRDRPIVGLNLVAGFKFDGEANWESGTIYDPESGKTYKCTMKLKDPETLDVRGYIGIPALGRSMDWTRTTNDAEAPAEAPAPEA